MLLMQSKKKRARARLVHNNIANHAKTRYNQTLLY
jgi:hypothetical protein